MNRSTMTALAALSLFAAGCAGNTAAGAPDSHATGSSAEVHAHQLPSDHAFTIDNSTVRSGPVSFTFVNDAKDQHEMIVLKTDTAYDAIPVGSDFRVSEDASVGEISETDAGATVTKTFDLAPGSYVLLCNIPLHYGQGMRLAFTVTG